MASISRVRVALTGFNGGPGVSTFYCQEPTTFVPLLRAAYLSLAGQFPDDVSIQVEPQGDIIEDTTGTLTGTWDVPDVPVVAGAQAGSYAAPAGLTIQWNTSTINDGSRVVGRTFMVPLASIVYEENGSITQASLDLFRASAATILTTSPGNLTVWRRPREARAETPSLPGLAARAGTSAVVTSATVRDIVAILRSRRD